MPPIWKGEKMKLRAKVLTFILVLALVVCMISLVACNKSDDKEPEQTGYTVSWANGFGTVSFFNGESLIGQGKLGDHLDLVAQETLEIDGTTYVVYSFLPLTNGMSLPEFTKVKFIATDNTEKTLVLGYNSLSTLVAVVGTVQNGTFTQYQQMGVLIKGTSNQASDIFANLTKVVFDPVEKLDLDTITVNDVTVYNGDSVLFTFTKNDLKALEQYVLTLTAEEKQYVAFKFTDIVAAKNATLPTTITKVKVGSMENEITSLANAYILVSKVENGGYETLNNIPRFVFNATTVTTMNTDVAKSVAEIFINPVDGPDANLTQLATLTFEWGSNGKDLTITVDADDNEFDSTITFTVGAGDAVIASITTSKGTIDTLPVVSLSTKTNNNGDKTYYGYTMTDIFSCIGKINNSMQFKAANYDVVLVRMTVGGSFSSTEIDDVSTGYVIDWLKSGTHETRVFKNTTDIRSVQSITLYKAKA